MAHVFYDYRGLVQLRLRSLEDLAHIHDLDQARWSATSIPIDQLLVDKQLLAFLDADKDARIRVQDIRAAHSWALSMLKNPARLIEGSDVVRVVDLSDAAEKLRHLMTTRLQAPKGEVNLAQIRAFAESYKKQLPNGDGVVTPAQVGDESVRALCDAIVKFSGEAAPKDVGGEAGVDAATLTKFVDHAKAIVEWGHEKTWADALDEAVDKAAALADEIDRFFLLCDLVAQERGAGERLEATAEALRALDVANVADVRAYLAKVPLQRPTQAGILDVNAHLNPMFADGVKALFDGSLALLIGTKEKLTRLSAAQWTQAKATMAPIAAHKAKQPRDLGFAVDVVLAGASVEQLRALLEEDQRASTELTGLADLERLSLYQRWLLSLCNNMVSFPALFRLGERTLFEAGRLVLDGRNLTFCVHVVDRAAHKAVAEQSNIFIVYTELERTELDGTKSKRLVACAVTSGTRRGIAVGKRGVFYDRDDREHDAVVVDIIEKPISLYEAAIAPIVRIQKLIGDRIQSLTQSSLASLEKKASTQVSSAVPANAAELPPLPATAPPPPNVVVNVAPAAPPPPPPPPAASTAASGLSGLVVAGGLVVAALGSAAAFALQTLAKIAPLRVFAGALGLVVAIMALSAFLGWLKLRKRDLSTMLEACGWAFNVRIYLTRRHSLRFTSVPPLPKDSVRQRIMLPPADEQGSSLFGAILLVLLAALVATAVVFREPLLEYLNR
jgi:hypothetical protein